MSEVPEAAVPAVLRGLAQYVRGAAASELPPSLVPVKRSAQTPKGLTRHRDGLLRALEEDAFRNQVGHWLKNTKKLPLAKADLDALKLAVERPDGWAASLAADSAKTPRPAKSAPQSTDDRLEREKAATRKAKEELRRAREERDAAAATHRRETEVLNAELAAARKEIASLQARVRELERDSAKAANDLERERRKARAALEKANAQIDDLKRKLKEERATARAAQPASRTAGSTARRATPAPKAPRGPRKPLKPPKGRFEDEPETLAGWLDRDDVHLVVDGYNLTRNETSYGHLSLEAQRERLLDLLKKLAMRHKVETTLVWDGGDVPPASQRRRHGRVKVEFSKPGTEKNRADNHIVALVEALPPVPVIVATSDKGLQGDVRAAGATVATAQQLLALLR